MGHRTFTAKRTDPAQCGAGKKTFDIFSSLPLELVILVTSDLEPADLISGRRVCGSGDH